MEAEATLECPTCGRRLAPGATCPEDGTVLRPLERADASAVTGAVAREERAHHKLFIGVAIVFVVTFALSGLIVVTMLRRAPPREQTDASLRAPVAFQTAQLTARLDGLQMMLEERPDSPERTQGLEELKVLRIRVETTGVRDDIPRLTGAIDDWEHRYLAGR